MRPPYLPRNGSTGDDRAELSVTPPGIKGNATSDSDASQVISTRTLPADAKGASRAAASTPT